MNVTVYDDAILEGTETFLVHLGSATARVEIMDDDGVCSINPPSLLPFSFRFNVVNELAYRIWFLITKRVQMNQSVMLLFRPSLQNPVHHNFIMIPCQNPV